MGSFLFGLVGVIRWLMIVFLNRAVGLLGTRMVLCVTFYNIHGDFFGLVRVGVGFFL